MIEPPIGLLMPNTGFARPLGDAGNPDSWAFPLLRESIGEATIERLMAGPDEALFKALMVGARRLADAGAAMIVGAADGLLVYQDAVQEQLDIPVVLSSLVLLPIIEDELPPGRRAGVITLDRALATAEGKTEVGLDPATPVVALEADSLLLSALAGNSGEIDARAVEAEMIAAGITLKQEAGDRGLGAVLLESPLMGSYAACVMGELQVRTYDIVVLASKVYRELTVRRQAAGAGHG